MLLVFVKYLFTHSKNVTFSRLLEHIIRDKLRVVHRFLCVFIQLVLRFVHPLLPFTDESLVVRDCLRELIIKLTKIGVKRVNDFHLSRAKLLPPLFEFVLDLLFHLILPCLEL